jgi:hypothetical protein
MGYLGGVVGRRTGAASLAILTHYYTGAARGPIASADEDGFMAGSAGGRSTPYPDRRATGRC